MSYQVLARKWRPATFEEVVGQGHVVTALSNALDNDRVHHAFLFTGTRGVGKTTLARIFAKALNCERGISSTPCGTCPSCEAVSEGRYVDLIEVDAASRTKVDDTRDLLDNVQYAPTQGRFKVYLIDEVHMLSTHSFNALLKTLEEPPSHVKFLLATTDPQKLPMTILSRCIQFTLSALEQDEIVAQLQKILESEQIAFEQAALLSLARAADGSMRDALSLMDQAIAYGNANISEASIAEMLGLVDGQYIVQIFKALKGKDGGGLMLAVEGMVKQATQLKAALDSLISALHSASVYQQAPKAVSWKGENEDDVKWMATAFDAETLQLFYQIALLGKRDFDLAPDPRTGFEMVLMRLLAFQPDVGQPEVSQPATGQSGVIGSSSPQRQVSGTGRAQQNTSQATKPRSTPSSNSSSSPASSQPPVMAEESQTSYQLGTPKAATQPARGVSSSDESQQGQNISDDTVPSQQESGSPSSSSVKQSIPLSRPENTEANISPESLIGNPQAWLGLIKSAGLSGMGRQLAMNMVPNQIDGGRLLITVDKQYKQLNSSARQEAIANAMTPYLQGAIKFEVAVGEIDPQATAANYQSEQNQAAREQLQQSFVEDPHVQALVDTFDGEVDLASIKQTH